MILVVKELTFLFLISLAIRSLFIFSNGVSFHYDMSRDAFLVNEILQGNIKIQGPPTSTPGLYHGVAYYYLLAPGYFFGNGNPAIASLWLAIINSTAVIPIYLLAKNLFSSKLWGVLAGILFAISFQASQYGPWLSNPSPVLLTSAWFFYVLWLWQKGSDIGFILACIFAAISTQFQFFMAYLFILIPIFAYIFKIRLPSQKTLLISVSLTTLLLSSFLISALKFNSFGQVVQGFGIITESKDLEFRIAFVAQITNYINKLMDAFIYNLIPSNILLGGLFGFITIYLARSKPFILFSLLSSFIIFLFGGHNSNYVNVGIISSVIIGSIHTLKIIESRSQSLFLVTLVIILLSNLTSIFTYNPQGQTLLVIPDSMNLKNQLKLIDRTYEIADGKHFYINSITVPLWTNTTWTYLYNWYGKDKYGYLPTFYGPNQVGLLGDGVLQRTDQPLTTSFLIIEPPEGIPSQMLSQELELEDYKTKLVREESFGSIKLQLRYPISTPTAKAKI